jgi:hypothetical protein
VSGSSPASILALIPVLLHCTRSWKFAHVRLELLEPRAALAVCSNSLNTDVPSPNTDAPARSTAHTAAVFRPCPPWVVGAG